MTIEDGPSVPEEILSGLEGHLNGVDHLVPLIYSELKRLAAYHLKNERPNHTLSPTELVHEVFLVLRKQHSLDFQDRKYVLTIASSIMRRVLVNYAKYRKRKKRGEGKEEVHLDDVGDITFVTFERSTIDVIVLEDALNRLAKLDPRQVRIVELRFYGGLTFDEIAEVLGISLRTVMREWKFARTWLYKEIAGKN